MSHSPCVIGVRSAAGTLPARRWADMVDEDCALPAFIPRTPPAPGPDDANKIVEDIDEDTGHHRGTPTPLLSAYKQKLNNLPVFLVCMTNI